MLLNETSQSIMLYLYLIFMYDILNGCNNKIYFFDYLLSHFKSSIALKIFFGVHILSTRKALGISLTNLNGKVVELFVCCKMPFSVRGNTDV